MKRLRRIVLVLVALVAIAALVVWRMTWMAPVWYDPPKSSDSKAQQLADAAESAFLERSHQVREDDKLWSVRVRENQINAWLATRLKKWIEHDGRVDWPPQLGDPQVRLEHQRVRLALPIASGAGKRTIVLSLKPHMSDGRLRLSLEKVALGRLPVPGDPMAALTSRIASTSPEALDDPNVKAALEVLAGRRGIDPTFDLLDGRQIHIRNLMLYAGVMDVTAQTLQVDAEGPSVP